MQSLPSNQLYINWDPTGFTGISFAGKPVITYTAGDTPCVLAFSSADLSGLYWPGPVVQPRKETVNGWHQECSQANFDVAFRAVDNALEIDLTITPTVGIDALINFYIGDIVNYAHSPSPRRDMPTMGYARNNPKPLLRWVWPNYPPWSVGHCLANGIGLAFHWEPPDPHNTQSAWIAGPGTGGQRLAPMLALKLIAGKAYTVRGVLKFSAGGIASTCSRWADYVRRLWMARPSPSFPGYATQWINGPQNCKVAYSRSNPYGLSDNYRPDLDIFTAPKILPALDRWQTAGVKTCFAWGFGLTDDNRTVDKCPPRTASLDPLMGCIWKSLQAQLAQRGIALGGLIRPGLTLQNGQWVQNAYTPANVAKLAADIAANGPVAYLDSIDEDNDFLSSARLLRDAYAMLPTFQGFAEQSHQVYAGSVGRYCEIEGDALPDDIAITRELFPNAPVIAFDRGKRSRADWVALCGRLNVTPIIHPDLLNA